MTLLITAVVLFTGSSSRADDVTLVDTTARLNLRTCPATVGCRVLHTLTPATQLEVLERREEWLYVRVASAGDGYRGQGWVHSGYVTPAAARSERFDALSVVEWALHLWDRTNPAFFVVLTVLVLANVGARRAKTTAGRLAALIAASLATGAILLLNQFGPLLSRYLSSYLDLQPLRALWEVNVVTAPVVEYPAVVWFLLFLLLVGVAVSPAATGGRRAFLQGFATGLVLVPGLVLVLAVLGSVFWLLYQVLRFLGFLIGFLLIPFVWIFEHLLAPLLRLLAWPFVWLWENGLRDIVEFLGIPFVWLWRVILSPLLAVLHRYLLRPILWLALGVLTTSVVLFPVGIIGLAILESLRNAFKGSLDSHGLFSHGMSLGFLVFDATLLLALDTLGVMETTPPITLVLPMVVPVVGVSRLLLRQNVLRSTDLQASYRAKLFRYWSSSRAELFSACVFMPVFFVLTILFGEQD